MTAAVETKPLLLRWSTTVRCPRQAIYNAIDAPARERTEEEERWMFRGRRLGRDYAELLIANHGAVNVKTELAVKWYGGVGHIDAFVVPTGTVVEILSSAQASEAMRHVKLLQMVGYMEALDESKSGMLVVLNPVNFQEERTVVVKDTTAYEALVAQVHERVDAIKGFVENGELPERVCAKPSQARGHFCQHADHCFEGWTPPEPESVVTDPETVELVKRWNEVKAEEREAARVVSRCEKERKEQLEPSLAEAFEKAGEHTAGPFVVKRVDVARKPTVDVSRAILAGVIDEELLGPYLKPGAKYSTWAVETGADGEIDYGDHPFDDDLPL